MVFGLVCASGAYGKSVPLCLSAIVGSPAITDKKQEDNPNRHVFPPTSDLLIDSLILSIYNYDNNEMDFSRKKKL